MRRISLLYILVWVIVCACDTAGNVDPVFQDFFIKYYGEDGNQEAVDMLVNADGSISSAWKYFVTKRPYTYTIFGED